MNYFLKKLFGQKYGFKSVWIVKKNGSSTLLTTKKKLVMTRVHVGMTKTSQVRKRRLIVMVLWMSPLAFGLVCKNASSISISHFHIFPLLVVPLLVQRLFRKKVDFQKNMIWKDEEEAVCAKMKVIIEKGHNHKKICWVQFRRYNTFFLESISK